MIEQHLRHGALGRVARQHAGESAWQDEVAAIILVAENRAVALEPARCDGVIHELEFEADALAARISAW